MDDINELPLSEAGDDNVGGQPAEIAKAPPLWGSARLCYTICAFLAMVVQLCLRNTLNFVILCMIQSQPINGSSNQNVTELIDQCGLIDNSEEIMHMEKSGNLTWTRNQEFAFLGTFYYGYLVALPLAGRLADKFGGKLFFVHSLTVQSIVFMLIPYFAQRSYTAAVIVRTIQGFVAGCGNPSIYQLFSIWAHPTERTSFLSFAYGGYSVGTLLVFPISSFLCKFGWEYSFYAVGCVSLLFGICCQWFVYSSLEDHPRLSKDEYDYLKNCDRMLFKANVPWKSILSSVPVHAFVLTHIFHTYGIIVLTQMLPRFFKEAMHFSLDKVGLISAAPFLSAFLSKFVTIATCKIIETRPNLNLTKYRRFVYASANFITILLYFGIIVCTCKQRYIVIFLTVCIGITTDMGFSGAYWPSLLYVAPAFAGLLTGIANCLATASGFLAPLGISYIVKQGNKNEWDLVMISLMASYLLGAFVYGFFGSSKLQLWGQRPSVQANINIPNDTMETYL